MHPGAGPDSGADATVSGRDDDQRNEVDRHRRPSHVQLLGPGRREDRPALVAAGPGVDLAVTPDAQLRRGQHAGAGPRAADQGPRQASTRPGEGTQRMADDQVPVNGGRRENVG